MVEQYLDTFSDSLRFLIYPGLPSEETRRRQLFAIMSVGSVIIAIIATTRGYYKYGFYAQETLISLFSAVAIGGILLSIRLLRSIRPLYIIAALYFSITILYAAFIGSDSGTTYLWLYVFPSFVYTLLGAKQGFMIVVTNWLAACAIVAFNLGSYEYPPTVAVPFILSYTLACIAAYSIELSRMRYYDQLQAEKLAIESAHRQIEALENLLPICASCKKIRDDSGYWHQVESYMHNYRGIAFSHGICPDCRTAMFASPVIFEKSHNN